MKRFFRRHLKSLLIILAIIALVVVLVVMFSKIMSHGTDKNVQTADVSISVGGINIQTFTTSEDAKKNPVELDANTEVKINEDFSSAKISLIQENGSNQDFSIDEKAFTINANAFSMDETVVVKVVIQSGNYMEQKLGVDSEEKMCYFAFNPKHIAEEVNTTNTTSEGVAVDTTGRVQPSGTIMYGESTYYTYSTPDEALQNPVALPTSLSSDFKISAELAEGTARMNFWVDWADGGKVYRQELFLSRENRSENFDLTPYAGQTVLVVIASVSDDRVPITAYSYVCFKVPETVGTIDYEQVPSSTATP